MTFLILIGASGCATLSSEWSPGGALKKAPSRRPKPTARETSEFKAIELFFQKGLWDSMESKADFFSDKYPESRYLPSVDNLRGLALLRAKSPQKAIHFFKRAIEGNPADRTFSPYVLYNLATAQFDANQIDDAEKTLNSIRAESLNPIHRLKIRYLKASVFSRKTLPIEAARELLVASRWLPALESPEQKKAFSDLLNLSLQSIESKETLENFLREFEDTPVADALFYHLGAKELSLSNPEMGTHHLKTLMARFPQSSYFHQATELLAKVQVGSPVDTKTIGVLLPLKGRFGRFGYRTLQGIQLALGIFGSGSESSDSGISLAIEDAGDEPEQAVKALEKLVLKHHAVAVIGPMLSKGIDQVAQKAQDLGTPLISLARRSVPQKDYVFHAGLNQENQAYEIVRHAVQKLGLKKFAAVYPNDKTGLETAQSFWNAVESFGGKLVGIETYSPDETDFRRVVDKLSGLYYPEARQRELDMLSQEREANNIKKRTRKTDQFFRLRPIVDFEAVFIADEPKVAGQIFPTFAYRDVENIKFLGTSAWNAPDFVSRTQGYGDNAVFVEAFFAGSDSPASKRFLEEYRTVFKQDPTAMEALAYDATQVVANVVQRFGKSLKRSDVNARLSTLDGFSGVTGTLRNKDGIFFRGLQVLTVKGGKITVPEKTS